MSPIVLLFVKYVASMIMFTLLLLLQAELEKAVSSHGDTLVLVNFFSMRNSLCTSFMTVYEVSIQIWWMIFKSFLYVMLSVSLMSCGGFRGHDCMVVGFTTTCAISAYHHYSCEFEPRSWRGVRDITLCDEVYQWLVTGWWFSPGTTFPPPIKRTVTI